MSHTATPIITGQHPIVPRELLPSLERFYGGNLRDLIDSVLKALPHQPFQKVEIMEEEAPRHAPVEASSGGMVSGYTELRFMLHSDDLDTTQCIGIGIYHGVRDFRGIPVLRGFNADQWRQKPTNPKFAPIVLADGPESEFFRTGLIAAMRLKHITVNGVEL